MIRHLVLLFIACALLVLPNTTFAKSQKNSIPDIESWEEVEEPTGFFTNKFFGHPTKITFTWHKKPGKNELYGGVVYYYDLQNKKVLVAKIWNLKLPQNSYEYHWYKLRAALLMENDTWVVGSVGEIIDIKVTFSESEERESSEYRFSGKHKKFSRTLIFIPLEE